MTLPLDKSTLVRFLAPVGQITEKCVLKVTEDKLYTLSATPDTNIILYACVKIDNANKESSRINISDVKKLLVGIDCFEDDLTFSLKENHLLCSTNSLSGEYFKYHLVDDAIIKEYPLNINKIVNLNFNTSFDVNKKKLADIARGSSYARSTQKIYFFCKNNIIYAELNDFAYQNVDNITFMITDVYEGETISSMLPLDLEIFRILNSLKCETVKVKINNENKVVMFSVNDGEVELKYIISTLVK
jgi:hypothetical protein